MLLGSNGGGGGLGAPAPCESTTVLQTEARFISSHIKEAEVGPDGKDYSYQAKTENVNPPFHNMETGSQQGSGSVPQLY